MKKWFSRIKIKKSFLIIPVLLGGVILMGFISKEQNDKTLKNIFIHIDYGHDTYFVSKEDVLNLMTLNGSDELIGEYVDKISLKELEVRIKSHNFVSDAQVFKDHKGNITVKVGQCKPIARIIDPKGPDAYISSSGTCLPASEKFTARVMLIDGGFAARLKNAEFLNSPKGQPYFNLLRFIEGDKFWKAQIAQVSIDKDGALLFYTQIGDQVIEFGKPENYQEKFRKLKIFYRKIYPFKGYNKYDRVSLKYKNQIVCE